jgi:hypothetical protein
MQKMETSYKMNKIDSLKMNKSQRVKGKMMLNINWKTLKNQFENKISTTDKSSFKIGRVSVINQNEETKENDQLKLKISELKIEN